MSPVPNEFTPEDEALFAEHGVPLSEPAPVSQPDGEAETPPPTEPVPHLPPAEGPARDDRGRFTSPDQPPAPTPVGGADEPPGGDATATTPPPGFVPHAALHQERLERQRISEQFALLQARTNALLAQSKPEAFELPDLEDDPVGYVRTLGESLRTMHEQQAQEYQISRMDEAFEQDEALFASYTPDYNQAAEYFANSRMTELSQFYPREQIQRTMISEAREIARMAWQRGVPAAQMVYQMAQARGYRAPAKPNGATPPPAAPAPAPTPAATVAAARNNQQVSRSLSNVNGTGATTMLNAEALLSMSDEEFSDYLRLGEKGANQRFEQIG